MQVNSLELEYRWLDAAKSYEQMLDFGKESQEVTAQYWQRIGYCYSLASRQQEDVDSFRRLRQHSVEAYQKAANFFGLGAHEDAKGLSLHCFALAELNLSWLASSSQEKNGILKKCQEFCEKASNAFNKVKAELSLGETYITLATSIFNLQSILEIPHEKRSALKEALHNTYEATAIFSRLDRVDELVYALSLSSIMITVLKDVSIHEKWRSLTKTSLEQANEAAELSKKTRNPYSIAISSWARTISMLEFGETGQKANSLEYPIEMLEQATKVGDKYLAGMAYLLLANTLYNASVEEDDPTKREGYYSNIIKYSENSIKNLQVVSQFADIAIAHTYYNEACSFSAREFAVTPFEKRATFEKGIKIGKEGMEYAKRSGSHLALWCCNHGLSKAFYYSSGLESKKDGRVKLLEKALAYREDAMKEAEKAFVSNVWFTGIDMVYAAQIGAELSRLEKDKEKKAMFNTALRNMEKALSQCKKQFNFFRLPDGYASVATNEEILGRMREENYF